VADAVARARNERFAFVQFALPWRPSLALYPVVFDHHSQDASAGRGVTALARVRMVRWRAEPVWLRIWDARPA